MTNTTNNRRPTYEAFNVKDREGKKGIWTKIGAAWDHEDGDGLSLQLDFIPLTGKIVLRKPESRED